MTPDDYRRELARRMNAQDLVGTLDLISDDAVYFWSNGAALFGKAAITEGLRQNFEGIENDAYETGELEGKPVGGRGRGTSALRRVDGEWRTVHEHLSAGTWKSTEASAS